MSSASINVCIPVIMAPTVAPDGGPKLPVDHRTPRRVVPERQAAAEGPDRQPRRDRRPGDPGLQGRRHRRVSRCTPTRTADALFVRLADEAHSLGGATPADSYLDIEKIVAVAEKSGADSVHPGYGFLAENRDFAQAVIDAGLVWIGPPPTRSRTSATRRGPRTSRRRSTPRSHPHQGPGKNADEIIEFAEENGLRWRSRLSSVVAVAASRSPARTRRSPTPSSPPSAWPVSAFGRGECLVEKFLDKPRHVETQCLADQHGNVVVVSTRDCSCSGATRSSSRRRPRRS